MERNITLLKITSTLANSWFWLGIWLLYYLSITDYKGVGIIETVAFANGLVMEIPTGAISDLMGKRKSLIIGYAFMALGNIIMSFSNSLTMLVLSVFILGPGYGLVSGTKEAFVFDSLKQIKQQSRYESVIADINKYRLVGLALASLIGGLLYRLSPSLPFLITGLSMLGASIVAFFFIEPQIDTDKFSFSSFIQQNKAGFISLKNGVLKSRFFVLVILLAAFAHLKYQVFDTALAIEFGFTESQLGIFFAFATLATAAGSHYYIATKKKLGLKGMYAILFLIYGFTIIVSPFVGLFSGGVTIMLREYFNGYANILATDAINKTTTSDIRATTISTYYMIVGLPYAISAYFIGGLIDLYTPSVSLVMLFAGFVFISLAMYGRFSIQKK